MKKNIKLIAFLLIITFIFASCATADENVSNTTLSDDVVSHENNSSYSSDSSSEDTPFSSDYIKGLKMYSEELIYGQGSNIADKAFNSERGFMKVILKKLESKGFCEIPDSENASYPNYYLSIAEVYVEEIYKNGQFIDIKKGDTMRIIVPVALEDETVKIDYGNESFEKYNLLFTFPAAEVGKEYLMYIGNVTDSVILKSFSSVLGEDISSFASYSYPLFTDDFTQLSYMNEQNLTTAWGKLYIMLYDAHIKSKTTEKSVETWLYNCIKKELIES
jgi:hypothetical protein